MVTVYNGNPGGAGNGGDTLNFSNLTPFGSYNYYTVNFGTEARAGYHPGDYQFLGDAEPFYHATNYSMRIIGQFDVARPGTYIFSTTSDDGSVLKIDNRTVVSNNFYQAFTTRTGPVTLAPGIHNFEVQFFQGGGGKGLNVGSGPSAIDQLPAGITIVNHTNLPQLKTTVYNDASGVAMLGDAGRTFNVDTGAFQHANPVAGTLLTPDINFDYATGSRWSPFGLSENYSDVTEGFLRVAADGMYTFGLNSDDGSWLYIDVNNSGTLQQIVNNGGFRGSDHTSPRGNPQSTSSVFLTAGFHPFEVRHFQGGGWAGVNLYLPDGVRYATAAESAPLIPEPATINLVAWGIIGLAAFGWSRWKQKV
jgi:hypothetical protein